MEEMKISAVVIAKNEEKAIGDCLDSLGWVDDLILINNASVDRTVEIAESKGVRVIEYGEGGNYTALRNAGLKAAKGEWILYLDADERVSPELRNEIQNILSHSGHDSYAIPRRNIILGREMKHGGWWPDYVKRLFRRKILKEWTGELHEEPVYEGVMGHLTNTIVHLKHTSLSEMVEKTNKWSGVEAKLLFESGHPMMTWWRFPRIMLSEFWYRLVKLQGFRDGIEGVIYSLYQMWSRFVTYAKLWEMQKGNSEK